MGGDKPWPQVSVTNRDHTEAAVVIIGAGLSGMCTAIDLLKRNKCKNFIVLEKSGGIGGTWRDNRYPGCCCDVWSHLYSYSFEQNPDWTREYPGQEEILHYLVGVAQKYELYRYIRFNTCVDSAHWDDTLRKWKISVTVSGGKETEFGSSYTLTSDFLVSAIGQLNFPKYPDYPGLSDFKGKIMHSARWDWSYNIAGKRIAIIGNGATAAQIIPEVAKVAAKLTVHQRTPSWVVPRLDTPIAPWKRSVFRYLPFIRWRYRANIMDIRETYYHVVNDNNSDIARRSEKDCKEMMRAQLPGREDLWQRLEPKYLVGCKRVVISDDYFPVFRRDNVALETGRIEKFTERGIAIEGRKGEEEEYDIIICATGFRTLEFMYPIDVTGSSGLSLASIWGKSGSRALYGVTVESLPNFAMLYGPNSNLGHSSIILMIESQSRYINALIKEVLKARVGGEGGSLVITPKKRRVEEYNEVIQAKLQKMSFADPNCASWYKTKDGLITNNWSGTVIEYQKMMSQVNWSDYDLSGAGAEAAHLQRGAVTKLGRVVEETIISYQAMGWTAASVLAVAAAVALKNSGPLRLM